MQLENPNIVELTVYGTGKNFLTVGLANTVKRSDIDQIFHEKRRILGNFEMNGKGLKENYDKAKKKKN